LAKITEEQLSKWMQTQDFPQDVVQSFKGKSMSAGTWPGQEVYSVLFYPPR